MSNARYDPISGDDLLQRYTERIAALEAEVEADQTEHDNLMAYVKRIKPDAHSVYEVIDQLKARIEQAKQELAEERARLTTLYRAAELVTGFDWGTSVEELYHFRRIVAMKALRIIIAADRKAEPE